MIPTLNEAAHVESVLAGVLAEQPSFRGFQVVVADGGSTDGTVALVEALRQKHPALSLIHNDDRIQSAGVNLAVRKFGAGADVLIRCDAHSHYPPRYCARLIETMTARGADAVVVPMDSRSGGNCVQRAVAWVSNSPVGTGGSAHRGGHRSGFVDHGHHAAFRLDTFRKVGGYDETFTHNEDAEFDCRQRALGGKIYLDSEIRIGYQARATLAGLGRQYFRYGAGRSRTVRRHPGSARLRQLMVPAHLLLTAVCLSVAPWVPQLLAWPIVYLLVLAATSGYFAVRHRSWCGLATGPAAAVMHTAWGCGFLGALVLRREQVWQASAQPPLEVAGPLFES